MEKKDKYYLELEQKLLKTDPKQQLKTLQDLRRTGHARILPLIFQLANQTKSDEVKKEVFDILGQLKEKECVEYLVKEISSGNSNKNITQLLASCWQSGLDYSEHIIVFAEQFVIADYVSAIEAFTVIEEWIHDSSPGDIKKCKDYLLNSISDISEQKKPLYHELVKLVESYM